MLRVRLIEKVPSPLVVLRRIERPLRFRTIRRPAWQPRPEDLIRPAYRVRLFTLNEAKVVRNLLRTTGGGGGGGFWFVPGPVGVGGAPRSSW